MMELAEETSSRGQLLVAEDDPDMRHLIATILQKDGYEVVEAANGVDLLSWIQLTYRNSTRSPFDAIVSDINMPDLSATEVLEALRCQPTRSPVILITAFGDPETRQAAYDLGVHMVVDKPFDPNWLRAAVRSAISQNEPRP
jgi:CheY-like chemotaxis protein